MTAQSPDDYRTPLWDQVGQLVAWFDRANGRDEHEITLRIFKIAEEFGEAAAARIGVLGSNPRKGVTHTMQDVRKELADTIVTGMVALASIDPDPATFLDTHLAFLVSRIPPTGGLVNDNPSPTGVRAAQVSPR